MCRCSTRTHARGANSSAMQSSAPVTATSHRFPAWSDGARFIELLSHVHSDLGFPDYSFFTRPTSRAGGRVLRMSARLCPLISCSPIQDLKLPRGLHRRSTAGVALGFRTRDCAIFNSNPNSDGAVSSNSRCERIVLTCGIDQSIEPALATVNS
jgi:hypothetical protein